MKNDTPVVSIVVPVYNDRDRIERLLESLLSQRFEGYETIVVDDRSEDGTFRTLEEMAQKRAIRLYRSPENRGSGFARNLGVLHARGEVIAFTDSDCVVDVDWLRELTRPILTGEAEASMGPNHICLGTGRCSRLESIRAKQYWGMDTKNMAIRKEVFVELGGFNETIKVNVDAEFHRRYAASGREVALTEATVYHDFPEDVISLILKARKRGREEAKVLDERRGLTKASRITLSRMLSKVLRLESIWDEGENRLERLAMVVYYISFHLSWNLSLLVSLTLPRKSEKG